MSTPKTAFVFGASGLVGGLLVKELIQEETYGQIILPVRKPLVIIHPKVREITLDDYTAFDFTDLDPEDVRIFCCVGTTIRKAKSKEAFRKVDYELPLHIAEWASQHGIPSFLAISSIGAKAGSGNFYLRTKGEMEESISHLQIPKTIFIRPSLLMGTRDEFRLAEELAKAFSGWMKLIFRGSLKKYRAIQAITVARAMIRLAEADHPEKVYESDRLEELGNQP